MTVGSSYDAIIIGAGHNGLVAACYLARAGKRVLVLERRGVLGGACVTEEVFPGFKVSVASYVISLFLPQIIRQLRLADYGFKVLPRNPSSFTPFPDGRYLLLGPDPALNHREIAKFSTRDADRYPQYEALLDRVARFIEPTLTITPPNLQRGSVPQRLRAAWDALPLLLRMQALAAEVPEAVELLVGSATRILDRWFESDQLKATLATDAIIGTLAPPSAPGTAYVLLHHVMGEAGGARGVWGYVQGGMGGLTQALAAAARDLKVEIRTGAEVSQILVHAGHVMGVSLANGTEFRAPVVASGADAHVTFEKLLDPTQLPARFRDHIRRIDYSSASMKINVALSELPRFTALGTAADQSGCLRGTIHVSPTMEYLERAYDNAKYGRPSQNPILECTIPSTVDATVAPAGKHLMSMFVQYAPYRLRESSWDEVKESFADRCLDVLAEYAPNIKSAVIGRQVLSPLDLEREFNLTGGNIFQGAMSLDQLFLFRPAFEWSDYRTPIRGLYLCGAAAHPGGGVLGACGLNAAREILRDRLV